MTGGRASPKAVSGGLCWKLAACRDLELGSWWDLTCPGMGVGEDVAKLKYPWSLFVHWVLNEPLLNSFAYEWGLKVLTVLSSSTLLSLFLQRRFPGAFYFKWLCRLNWDIHTCSITKGNEKIISPLSLMLLVCSDTSVISCNDRNSKREGFSKLCVFGYESDPNKLSLILQISMTLISKV